MINFQVTLVAGPLEGLPRYSYKSLSIRSSLTNKDLCCHTGLPVKPMWFVERVFIPIEEQYKYVSESNSDTDDEEWTLGPSKKKKKRNDETIAVSTGEIDNEFVNLKNNHCNSRGKNTLEPFTWIGIGGTGEHI